MNVSTSCRERAREVVHLAGDVVDVGHEPIDGDHDDQRGNEREERVERDSGRDEREVVRSEPLRQLQTDLPNALHDPGRHRRHTTAKSQQRLPATP